MKRAVALAAVLVVAAVASGAEGWGQTAELIPDEAGNRDRIGTAVHLRNGTAVVGAPGHAPSGGARTGAAFVYVGGNGSWSNLQRLTATDGQDGDRFGDAVDRQGETIVVGASQGEKRAGQGPGAAYIFERTAEGWSEEVRLDAGTGDDDGFGADVAVAGDRLVVGAPRATLGGAVSGAAYVFARDGSGWSRTATLRPDSPESGQQFGASVAIEGQTAVVGAPATDTPAGTDSGAVTVFADTATGWTRQTTLIPSAPADAAVFGTDVAFDGELLVVGAPNDDGGGSATVFVRQGSSWQRQATLSPTSGERDRYGASVSLDGDRLAVGAPHQDPGTGTRAGAVHLHERSGGSWDRLVRRIGDSSVGFAEFGTEASIDGDELLVGAPAHPSGDIQPGAAFVFDASEPAETIDDGGNGDDGGDGESTPGPGLAVVAAAAGLAWVLAARRD